MFLQESYILEGGRGSKKDDVYKTTQFQVGVKKYSKYSVSFLNNDWEGSTETNSGRRVYVWASLLNENISLRPKL